MKAAPVEKPKRASVRRFRLVPIASGDEERRFQTFLADSEWADEHYQELLAEYPEQWIAVWKKRVIASDSDLMALRAKVPDPPYTYHVFLTKQNGGVIL